MVARPPGSAAGLRRSLSARDLRISVLLLVGLAAAVALRTAVGGEGVARSPVAGLLFAAVLTALAAGVRLPPRGGGPATSSAAALAVGLAGAVVLCVPALLSRWSIGTLVARPGDAFLGWAAVVAVVATAEEWFLRGVLHRLLERRGTVVTVGVPALAFAALHLPLYGASAFPLDLAVGVWLGALRVAAGRWSAPAVAHVVADWAAWFLA